MSPVFVDASFGIAPMSPAPMYGTSDCFLPLTESTFVILSCAPVRILMRGASELTLPETTFTYESLPMNGSATVLNTIAAAAPLSLTETSTGSPSRSTPISPLLSAADGASHVRLFKS